MSEYTDHPDSLFQVGAPILGSTQQEQRDNLLAVVEGDATAPKVLLPALERLTAGGEARSRFSETLPNAVTLTEIYRFNFMQNGTIRCNLDRNGASGTSEISRVRNGATVTLLSSGVSFNSVDVSVRHGDALIFSVSTGSSAIIDVALRTDGGNLWAGAAAILEGNDV